MIDEKMKVDLNEQFSTKTGAANSADAASDKTKFNNTTTSTTPTTLSTVYNDFGEGEFVSDDSCLDEIIVKRKKPKKGKKTDEEGTEITDNGSTVFYEYVDRDKIGEKIFAELYQRFDTELHGFRMDDVSPDSIGILSQCQCLQSWVSLSLDFELPFDKTNIIKGQKYSIRQIMDFVIKDLISRIIVTEDGEKKYIFGASPYIADEKRYFFNEKIANIDAITWVIPTFITILKLHADKNENCIYESKLIEIIRYGLKYINDSFIDFSPAKTDFVSAFADVDEEENSKLKTGWNFTKNCKEPSLYYTFAVGECYLDMYRAFEDILEHLYAKKYSLSEEFMLPLAENADENYEALFDEKRTERADSNKKLARILKMICMPGAPSIQTQVEFSVEEELVIEGTEFDKLNENLRKTGIEIWKRIRTKFADNFFYNDLAATLSEKDIMMSTTSDALFNTVYIVNIMLAGGIDEYFELKVKSASQTRNYKVASIAQREKDNLLESCMLAIQKAFRTYEKLKNQSKDYIVDQFLIGFNERFDEHKALVGELRKLRMKTFSLLPMLIHTNNVISEYLIKYPQYNMVKYLKYILQNRYVSLNAKGEKESHWVWESDGYFSGSNAYYIVALIGFYKYYETYEKKYIPIAGGREALEKDIIEGLEKDTGRISVLKTGHEAAIKTLSAEYEAKLKEKEARILELENLERPVEDAVKAVIAQELEQNIVSILTDVFYTAAGAFTLDFVDSTKDEDGKYSNMLDAFMSMVTANGVTKFYTNDIDYKEGETVDASGYNDAVKKGKSFLYDKILSVITDAQGRKKGN